MVTISAPQLVLLLAAAMAAGITAALGLLALGWRAGRISDGASGHDGFRAWSPFGRGVEIADTAGVPAGEDAAASGEDVPGNDDDDERYYDTAPVRRQVI